MWCFHSDGLNGYRLTRLNSSAKTLFFNSNRCSEPVPAPHNYFILQLRTAARPASPMMGQKTGPIAAKPPARRAIQQNKNGGAVSAKSPCSRPTMAGLKQ
jgi:hypothetical protein